ncbi:hypothetical protein RclHR1_10420003 [Rhizophagus clarus]|nr:hypothetical protein RclHR1_10420003 [Rhizophagus clarus]
MGTVPSTPHYSNPITLPATLLFQSQKKSARKKLKKLQQQQQTPDDNPFIVSSGQSPEQIPPVQRWLVTFNNIPSLPVTSLKSSDNKKPLE